MVGAKARGRRVAERRVEVAVGGQRRGRAGDEQCCRDDRRETESGACPLLLRVGGLPSQRPERRACYAGSAVFQRGLDPGVERVEAVQRERLGAARSVGAPSAPWCSRTQCSSSRRRGRRAQRRRPLADHPHAELDMAEHPALVADPDLGAVGELARLAEVVDERGADQQVMAQPRVQHARLERERADRDRVLEQPAEVGVMAAARARRAAPLGTQLVVGRAARAAAGRSPGRGPRRRGARGSRRARRGRGRRRAGTRPDRRPRPRRARSPAARPGARRGSARRGPRRATRSPRSKRPASVSASRNARAWTLPVRSRSSTARYGAPARVVSRSLRVQANVPTSSWPGRRVAIVGGSAVAAIVVRSSTLGRTGRTLESGAARP